MTVAPLIAMKSTKCESLEAVGKELDRRAHTYANDVDQSGRHVGYLCRAGTKSRSARTGHRAPYGRAEHQAENQGQPSPRDGVHRLKQRCLGLRGRVEQVVDGIRGAVGRAEMAIADLARKLGPRSARMTTRALKRDLAALEKDMSPVTLASEARDAARASNARRGNVPQRDCGQSR